MFTSPKILPVLALLAALPAAGQTPAPATPPPVERRFTPDELRADLADMYRRLQESHFDLYARRSRAEYDARFAGTSKSFDRPLTPFEAAIAFQKFAAYGNVAHSRVDLPPEVYAAFREKGGKVLPFGLRIVAGKAPGGPFGPPTPDENPPLRTQEEKGAGGGAGRGQGEGSLRVFRTEDAEVYVGENLSGLAAIAAGDRLLAVDGEPAAALVARLEEYVSADNAYLAHAQLEPRFAQLLWLDRGERPQFRLRLQRGDAAPFELTVPARTGPEMLAERAKLPAEALDWDRREAKLLDGGIAYLRPGPFYDNRPDAASLWDPAAFHQFVDDAFHKFLAAGATRLLIDLRKNPGGDDSFSNRMIAWFASRPFRFASQFLIKVSPATVASNRARLDELEKASGNADDTSRRLAAAYAGQPNGAVVDFPIAETPPRAGERFKGKVFLLIDRRSYSNTANVAALVQDYGFGKILGEETSDLATTYGAMEQFTLPRTGIRVGFPKARILRPSGNLDARGVIPDVPIAAPLVPGSGDPMLEQALAIVRASPQG